MKLNLKTIGIAIGAFVVVLAAAVGLFIAFFPKELAAAEAERRIEEATGRELTLGAVDLSFWPALGFSAEAAVLSNPEGFPAEEPFIAAERIVFAVALMPLLTGKVEVKQLIFEGADVRLVARAEGGANWDFPTDPNQSQDQASIEDLRLDDVRFVDGRISFQGAEGEPLVLEDVDASLALRSLDEPAQLTTAFTYRGQRLDIESEIDLPRAVLDQGETPLSASISSALVEASFNGVFDAATGALTGSTEARGASVRQLMAWLGSPMGEGGGFGAFSLAAQMAREDDTTTFTDATVRLDNINATGTLSLVAPDGAKMRVTGALRSPSVNLNPYLPAAPQGEGGVNTGAAWSTTPLDLSGLRALDADLTLSIGALQFQRMDFSDVEMSLRVADGAADARLTQISLYGGGGTARLVADGSGETPRIAAELNAQNIQAEPLLRDAIGFDRIVGRGQLRASLVGAGGSQAAIMRSLRGTSSFSFNDGQWKGVNLAQVARTVQSALSGQAAAGGGGGTDFAELAADFTVSNGAAATENLRLLNPFVRLEGRGIIDIGAQSIDMRISPRAVNSMQGQGGQLNAAGLGVPFRVSGPWSGVSFRPALEDIVQSQLGQILGDRGAQDPFAALGGVFSGGATQPAAPAEEDAEQPAPTEPAAPRSTEDRVRDAIGGFMRGGAGNQEKEKGPGG